MAIKAFGYAQGAEDAQQATALSEVTFVAAPDVLRRLAQHLLQAAAELEKHPNPPFDHSHLQDEWEGWSDDDVDVIVAR
jgi:hypothetical protein